MEKDMEYKGQRVNFIYNSILTLSNFVFNTYFSTTYEGTEKLKTLKREPFIVLSFPHTFFLDVPLEGCLLRKHLDRPAYFLMAEALCLQPLFKRAGGIPIRRSKDILLSHLNENGYVGKAGAMRVREVYENIIPSLLKQNEIIVIHPEAGIDMNGFHQRIFRELIKTQEIYGKRVPFVPFEVLNIGSFLRPRSKCHIRVHDTFEASTAEEIRKTLERYI
jgi:1-acyl-sn-glycerol-3-phosphate acyltransferase